MIAPNDLPPPKRLVGLLFPVFGSILFVILTTIAMMAYPGGTFLNPTAPGYSFTQNYFSDLGRTISRIGVPNLISSTCFAIATVGSGLLMIPYCLLIPQAFPPDSRVRILAKIGQIGGFISCAGYAGVGLAPANLFRTVHYTCLFIAFAGTVILSISIGSAIIRSKILAKRYAYLFLLLAIFFICYSAILIFGPPDSTQIGLYQDVIGQKIIIYFEMIVTFVQGLGTYLNVKKMYDH